MNITEEKIYSMKENWHLLKPFLDNEDVQDTLDIQMGIYCAMYPQYSKKWEKNKAPWKLAPSYYWVGKPVPQIDELEYYRAYCACHWINEFTAKLIEVALNVETDTWQSETHTVVKFIKDDVIYYADILKDWDCTQSMKDFMDSDYIPDF